MTAVLHTIRPRATRRSHHGDGPIAGTAELISKEVGRVPA